MSNDNKGAVLRALLEYERYALATRPVADGIPLLLWLAAHAPVKRLAEDEASFGETATNHAATCMAWAWSVLTCYAANPADTAFPITEADIESRSGRMTEEEFEALPAH